MVAHAQESVLEFGSPLRKAPNETIAVWAVIAGRPCRDGPAQGRNLAYGERQEEDLGPCPVVGGEITRILRHELCKKRANRNSGTRWLVVQ